jgi:hypothetical protein
MKLDLDLPLEAWHILDELLAPMESYIGVWLSDIDPLDVIQDVRRAIGNLENKS